MATTRGTWRLDEAIASHWRTHKLDAAFRLEWPDPLATEYEPLNDGEARPSPPGPYCVYGKGEPWILSRMSGLTATTERQEVRWNFWFRIHAKTDSLESGKQIAKRLARKVAKVFDPHNAIQIEDADWVTTIRGSDWHDRLGDDEWVWYLEFSWIVDCVVDYSDADTGDSFTPDVDVAPDGDEDDDVLDAADIGCVYDNQGRASDNTDALVAYLATRSNKAVALKFRGPKTYSDKREPAPIYFDLSSGAISIDVGGSGEISSLVFEGPAKIYGVSSATAMTPIFEVTRTAGDMPLVVFKNMVFQSASSVLRFNGGGSGLVLENVKIDDFAGIGTLDYENWTDVDNETCSYGIWLDDADGCRITNMTIVRGNGHGIVSTRLHAGHVQARVRECLGSGFKVSQWNGTKTEFWAESNEGYGLHARDCGVARYESGGYATPGCDQEGSASDWQAWFEANNGRQTDYTRSGYTFSQVKMDNCARVKLRGHSGWRTNQIRMNRFTRVRNVFEEEVRTVVSADADIELVTSNTVSTDCVLPSSGNSSLTNWWSVWTDASYRPTVAKVGTPGVDERLRVTWPAGCFDNTALLDSAYWRPFYLLAESSPASFYFEAQVQAASSEIPTYCAARESASNRQRPAVGGFQIAPVSGIQTTFALWDTYTRQFSGSVDVDDTRTDIQPAFIAFMSGMQDQEGNAAQDGELTMDILQWRFWKIS